MVWGETWDSVFPRNSLEVLLVYTLGTTDVDKDVFENPFPSHKEVGKHVESHLFQREHTVQVKDCWIFSFYKHGVLRSEKVGWELSYTKFWHGSFILAGQFVTLEVFSKSPVCRKEENSLIMFGKTNKSSKIYIKGIAAPVGPTFLESWV